MKPPRRTRPGLVGPLFYWELVRLARRGQDARARFILAGSLFVVLGLLTVAYFPDTPIRELFTGTSQSLSLEQSARFGNSFAVTFVIGQMLVLALLTPAYAAGGISEEKERRTLDYVLASDLTSREIVFGKFLGRLTFLLGVMFAGLPILSLTQLYGGVSLNFLLASYLLTASTVTLLAAVSAACACAATTYRGALMRAYGITAFHLFAGCGSFFLNPPAVVFYLAKLQESQATWLLAGGYAAAQTFAACGAVWYAVRTIRKMRARSGVPLRVPRKHNSRPELTPVILADTEATADLPTARRVKSRPQSRPRREPPRRAAYVPPAIRNRPGVDPEDPFGWKERYTTGQKYTADDKTLRDLLLAFGIAVGVILSLVALVALAQATTGNAEVASNFLFVPGVALLAVYLLQIGAAAAGMVIREQQRLTLESLLTIPVERRAILVPKWRACLTKGWVWGVPVLILIPLGFAATDAPATALPVALLTPAAAAAIASTGLWLSIRCSTLTRATLWLTLLVGAVIVAIVGIKSLCGPRDPYTPFVAVTLLVLGLAGVSYAFWRRAVREFEALARD